MSKALIGTENDKDINYDLEYLTRHAAVLGTTGSGKTVMCKVLIEEALNKGVPVIAIDPKGDIGSLGISNKDFDFRPFINKRDATKTSKVYHSKHYKNPLNNFNTQIFTPKSNVGIPVSLLPDLSKPKVFDKDDTNLISNFVTPIAESVTGLSGLKSNKEKVETLISQILIDKWSKGQDMDISSLIEQIINPEFDKVGSLDLEDFMKEKDRKKAAGSINLLLSSPAKKIWKEGVNLDMSKLFQKNSLSVFDLRHVNLEEKQFVAEAIMQKIYKYLLSKGGSEKLKYILYIDELAGLLPPPPSNPPSKKLLELLIRQARAFGLGIVVATQNPGDIDYKILGNIGTRFIGKLRTQNDIEKVASAMDMSASDLKGKMQSITTAKFFFNNSVKNSNKMITSRWLYTYHSGPLKTEHIKWINNPDLKPKITDKLNVDIEKERFDLKKEFSKKTKQNKKTNVKSAKKSNDNFKNILNRVKKNSDKVSVKISMSKAIEHIAHLKIVIEITPYKGESFPLQGPFTFDLSSKVIPLSNHLTGYTWSRYIPKNIAVEKAQRSIIDAFTYSKREAKRLAKTRFFESPLTGKVSDIKEDMIDSNHEFTKKISKPKIEKLERDKLRYTDNLNKKIKQNKKDILNYKKKLLTKKSKRVVKNIFSNRKLLKKTSEMKYWEKQISSLEKKNDTYKKRIEKKVYDTSVKKQKILDQAFDKARIHIKQKTYIPRHKDMIVHSTIYLIPKK